jgi:hypothetical protein
MHHNSFCILAGGLLLLAALFIMPVHAVSVSTGGSVGYFMISTDPPDGTVYFDGVDQGAAPVTVWVYTTGSPRHTVVVEKDGYQTWVQLLTTNPGKDQTIAVNAVLVPGVSYGVLRVESDVSGIPVTLDGSETMNVPATFSPVTTGYHTVASLVPGYLPYQEQVLVMETGTTTLQANLTPIVEAGTLEVTSSPSGADLYVNEAYLGKTPFASPGVAAGTYDIRLDLEGYVEWTGTAVVTGDEVETVNAVLAPLVTFPVSPATSLPTTQVTGTTPVTEIPTTRAGGLPFVVPVALAVIAGLLLLAGSKPPRS